MNVKICECPNAQAGTEAGFTVVVAWIPACAGTTKIIDR